MKPKIKIHFIIHLQLWAIFSGFELHEDPEQIERNLSLIKQWISEQSHLRARIDDQFLVSFLRGYKYVFKDVKQNIDLFYTCRGAASEFYNLSHRDPIFTDILETGCYLPLPEVSEPSAPRVVLIRPGVLDFSRYTITDVFSAVHIIDKILMIDDDNSVVAGNINIVDVQGFNVFNTFLLTPQQMKKLIVCQQDALPFRTLKTYAVNVPDESGITLCVNFILAMLSPSNRDEISLYGDGNEEVFTHIPRNIMPVEYGGSGGTLNSIIDHWKAKIEQYGNWLDEDMEYGTDEARRAGGPLDAEFVFGAPGIAENFLDVMLRLIQ